MYTITIYIAKEDAKCSDGTLSAKGHMWYGLSDGKKDKDGKIIENAFGFSSGSGTPIGIGAVSNKDTEYYQVEQNEKNGLLSRRTFVISEEQYNQMKNYGENMQSKYPKEGFDFSDPYSALWNSCIDFTWGALAAGGLNPHGFEGAVYPVDNIEIINKLGEKLIDGTEFYPDKDGTNGKQQFDTSLATVLESLKLNYLASSTDGTGLVFQSDTIKEVYDQMLELWEKDPQQLLERLFPELPWEFDLPPDPPVDPLALDLDGNGIETVAIAKDRYFDGDGDGFSSGTGWINSHDGLLALDRNGDGIINDGTELFGDQTVLQNGQKAKNGFEVLKDFDKNNDGRIDKYDDIWKDLRVWVDADGDGVTDSGELHTLDEFDIKKLFTDSKQTNITDAAGNTQNAAGSYETTDGSIKEMNNYLFESSLINSRYDNKVEVSEEVAKCAYLQGRGNAMDIWQTMMKDETGELQKLMEQFAATADPALREQLMDEILFKWTSSDAIAADARGKYFNAKEVNVLETFFGKSYGNTFNSDSVRKASAAEMHNLYESVKKYYMGQMMAQTHLKADFANVICRFVGTEIVFDFSKVQASMQAEITKDFAAGKKHLQDFVNAVWAMELPESNSFNQFCQYFISQSDQLAAAVYGAGRTIVEGTDCGEDLTSTIGASLVSGGKGNDTLRSTGDDVILLGGEGDDKLYGSSGSDLLDGGLGSDYLEGGAGDDTYLWGKGQGSDTINNIVSRYGDYIEGGVDTLNIGDGLNPEDISWSQQGEKLIATIKETGETLTFTDWFASQHNPVDKIVFADGTTLTPQEISALATIPYTEKDDTIMGSNAQNDVISGGAGNDKLYGYGGNDILGGGAGNDYLEGGHGDDTYLWGKGQGNDTINNTVSRYNDYIEGGTDTLKLGEGLTTEDIVWSKNGNNLIATLKETGETLTISNWFSSNVNAIDKIVFEDGTILTPKEIDELTRAIKGTEGNDTLSGGDTQDDILYGYGGDDQLSGNDASDELYGGEGSDKLYGGNGNDLLDGGAGNDYTEGGQGNDTYIWGKGQGSDTINNIVLRYGDYIEGGTDTLKLGEGIKQEDIIWSQQGETLIATLKETGETLTFTDWFASVHNPVDEIVFDDGTTLTPQEISALATISYTEKDDTVTGSNVQNDVISGGAGNDKLYGYGGNDILDGGAGDDYLEGGYGDDTYLWGKGQGNDTINNTVSRYGDYLAGGIDTLKLGEGIKQEDIVWSQQGEKLIATLKETGETLTFTDWFASVQNPVDKIVFDDGTILTAEEVNKLSSIAYTDKGDTITGSGAQNDVISGGAGNDKLYGSGGDDILDGGADNDYIEGGHGDDTYLWGKGQGSDTINNIVLRYGDYIEGGTDTLKFGEGIKPEDFVWSQQGETLTATLKETGETLTFTDWFASVHNPVDKIIFADGTILTAEEVNKLSSIAYTEKDDTIKGSNAQNDVISGGAGNDKLYGYSGNDILGGGAGNDYLEGGQGDDTYLWGKGQGSDTINNIVLRYGDYIEGGADTLRLGEGLNPKEISWSQQGETLIATIKETGETLTFTNWFASEHNPVDKIVFADGTILTAQEVSGLAAIAYTDKDDTIKGSASHDDTIFGGMGNDKLYGYGGNDLLDGGAGNDYLEGGKGNDTYLWGKGQGNDTINNTVLKYETGGDFIESGADTLRLGEGIKASDILWSQSGKNLTATIKETGETLTFSNWFANDNNPVDKVVFADGTVLYADAIEEIIKPVNVVKPDLPEDTPGGGQISESGLYINPETPDFFPESGAAQAPAGGEGSPGGGSGASGSGGGGGLFWTSLPWKKRLPPPPPVDPLVLDLDGNGIETLSVSKDRYFDADGDSFATGTGWVNAHDGLLVLDRNGDGIINDGTELFGDQTVLKNGKKARNGFEVLKDFDENNDGKLDKQDAIWKDLKVWIDANGNGRTDSGELHTLGDVQIKNLFTGSSTTNVVDEAGNIQNAAGSYTTADGYIREMNNYLFAANSVDTIYNHAVKVSEEVKQHGYLPGRGNVMDTWQAMMQDETGQLQKLMAEFAAAKDSAAQSKLMDEILFKWTNSDSIDADSRGKYLNAKEINVLETFFGRDYINASTAENVLESSAKEIHSLYENIKQYYMGWMMAQTHLKGELGQIKYYFADENKETVVYDFSQVQEGIQAKINEDFNAGKKLLSQFVNMVWAMELAEPSNFDQFCQSFINQGDELAACIYGAGRTIIEGTDCGEDIASNAGDALIYGGKGDDTLRAGGDNVVLLGGEGNDKLYGNNASDLLNGGVGNDYLEGGAGDDTYLWGKGQGNDTINNVVLTNGSWGSFTEGGTDTLKLGEGIKPQDIDWSKNGNNLIGKIKETGETITVTDWFANTNNPIDKIVFADGTILTPQEIIDLTKDVKGTEGVDTLNGGDTTDDELYGYGGDDKLYGNIGNDGLYGGEGNDKLYGKNGNDLLDGGVGNDYLEGGAGDDTYLWGKGQGSDTINNTVLKHGTWGDFVENGNDTLKLGEGIKPEDIDWSKNGNSLIGKIKETGETITVTDWFTDKLNSIDHIVFADGTTLTPKEIDELTRAIKGTEGNDTLSGGDTQDDILYGYGGDDKLSGNAGNDEIYGGEGNDKLYGNIGNDLLDGGDGGDYLEGGAGDDTYLWGKGQGSDTINNTLLKHGTWGDFVESGTDTLQLGEGIKPEDIDWSKNGNNLIGKIKETGETITVTDWFANANNPIDKIIFADGTILTPMEIIDLTKQVKGTQGVDTLNGGDTTDDVLYGYEGDDKLSGNAGNDEIYGGEGNDKLYGNIGNDLLDGGDGDDYLEGGVGDDTYLWGKGQGSDTINNTLLAHGSWGDFVESGTDTLQLGEGIKPEDIDWSKNGNNLIGKIKETGETITVTDWFANTNNPIDKIIFADETILTPQEIIDLTKQVKGTQGVDTLNGGDTTDDVLYGYEGDDKLSGNAGNDEIYGGEGNDKLYGNAGNDLLDGGVGDDYLEGGAGDDTYLWGKGQGNDMINNTLLKHGTWGDFVESGTDTLQLSEGIKPEDIDWSKNGNNLIGKIKETGETITVTDWFANANNPIDKIVFADGTILTPQEIIDLTKDVKGTEGVDTLNGGDTTDDVLYGYGGDDKLSGNAGNDEIYGGEGNDKLYGNAGNDLLDGGVGDDYLEGGVGDDTYLWGKGQGCDTINNTILKHGTWGDFVEGGNDTLRLGEGIKSEDIDWSKNGNNLIGKIKETGETITVTDWFTNTNNPIDRIVFADGTTLTPKEIGNLTRAIKGTEGNDTLSGGDTQDDILYGYEGDDILSGNAGEDELYGGAGNDKLYGNDGHDLIDGGSGDDYLEGGKGDDTYIWGKGRGNDTISNAIMRYGTWGEFLDSGSDTLKFGEGIAPEDIVWGQRGENLVAIIKETGETLTFTDWYKNSLNPVDKIEFADGTMLTAEEVSKLSSILYTDKDDTIEGSDKQNDTIFGGEGSDKLYGYGGNDLLDGGLGDDYLEGGDGDDTYLWGKGQGNDTIHNAVLSYGSYGSLIDGGMDTLKLGEGVKPEDIVWSKNGDNLIGTIKETGETLTVKNWLTNTFNPIDKIVFADGTTLTPEEINDLIRRIEGTENNDTVSGGNTQDDILYGYGGDDKLYGYNGNDILDGGTGNDYLEGGKGDDTYLWGKGQGSDTINNIIMLYGNSGDFVESGSDTIKLGEGITTEDIVWIQQGDTLVMKLKETGETLSVEKWFVSGHSAVDKIEFADGTVLKAEEVSKLSSILYTDKDDTIYGSSKQSDVIFGGEGSDKLYGYGGNDLLDGGLGDDYLEGGDGDDTYLWGKGQGNDTIHNAVLSYGSYGSLIDGGMDTLKIGEGINQEDIIWSKNGNSLIGTLKETGETLTFTDWYRSSLNPVDKIEFADGTSLDPAGIEQKIKLLNEAAMEIYQPMSLDSVNAFASNGQTELVIASSGDNQTKKPA